MYAVIETGGKQYRVELGSELAVERLDGAPGATIEFERVLLVADGDAAQIGTPTVADALVTGEVVRQDRGEKIIVFKYRPKARHRAKKGHRQEQTVIRVADIRFNGRSAAEEAGTQEKEQAKSRRAAAAAAEKKAAADQDLAAKLAKDEAAREAASTDKATAESKPDAKAKAAPAAKAPRATRAARAKAAPATSAPATADAPASTESTTKKAPQKKPTARRTSTKKDE